MKKIILVFFLLLTGCNTKNIEATQTVPQSYIVLDSDTNQVIEGSNIDGIRSIASVSKIMTAICVIENTNLYEYVKVPEEVLKADGSSLYLKVGEEILVLDLLYGLLLQSGNDAAITLSLTTCKTTKDFVNLMNDKAIELNLKNTMFSNPSGLDQDDNGNLSSSYDVAILYSYCLKNPLFAEIVSTKKYKKYNNKNKLLYQYEYCTGGKTGYTKKAKRTLVSSASKNNKNLIVVTLNYGNDFQYHKSLYEKYFK